MTDQTPQARFSRFPPTDWNLLGRLVGASQAERQPLLNVLASKYWGPIYQYLLVNGCEQFEAQDLAQDFFVFAFNTQLFAKANPERGRLRSLLLTALKNFQANERRRKSARQRHPPQGFASIDELMEERYLTPKVLWHDQTPENLFHQCWIRQVILNVLTDLKEDCRRAGKATHFSLFHARVVAPELEGLKPAPLAQQARELGLEYKEAANQITTVKRAFLRLLAKEINAYSASKQEAADEELEILGTLNWGVNT